MRKETARYEADTWYDAELKFNPSKAYMRFSFKKHSDSVWNTYDAFFTKTFFESPVDTTGGFSRIEIGYISAVDEAAYMDNIRYYTVGAEDIVPSMSSLNDDFSELPSTYTNGTTPDDYAKQWRTGNSIQATGLSVRRLTARGRWHFAEIRATDLSASRCRNFPRILQVL